MIRPTLLRLLPGGLLWLATDLLLWNAPRFHLLDGLLHAAAALALSALLLDTAWRRRARGLYGLLALAGLYGLAALIVFEPSADLAGLPRLLVARGLGAETLAGLLMLALWLTLLRGKPLVPAIIAAVVIGAGWSVQTRGQATPAPPLATLLIAGALASAAAFALWWLTAARSTTAQPNDLALSWRGQAIAALVVAAIAAYRYATGALDPLTLAVAVTLIVFITVLLHFQRSKRGVSLLESALPPAPPRAVFLLVPIAFVAGGALGSALPSGAYAALDVIVTAFGLAWLPAVSFAIGARSLLRQVRAQQL